MQTRRGSRTVALAGLLAVVSCGSRTGLDLIEGTETTDGGGHVEPGLDAGVDALRSIGNRLDCADAGTTYIYVIGEDNEIYSFDPANLSSPFTLIGTLECPAALGATPFSMAVDHKGVAYVVFDDGELFHVSTKTAVCEATSFVIGQHGFKTFGMGFVANVGDGATGETLYVAGDSNAALGKIDVDTFVLTEVAPFNGAVGNALSMAELTGTADGRLFGFFAPPNENNVPPSFIDQIDPATAKVLSSVLLPDVEEGNGWAFGFWGGDFYTFTAPTDTTVVTRYRPSDGSITQVAMAPAGVEIVGAGVSTCAPQQ